ncbi:MAG: hypothetical protein JRD89_00400 [Deltaproteobacteria bacterium]|nr:hypothetical protein [Deltaproteobacteria bacterium]
MLGSFLGEFRPESLDGDRDTEIGVAIAAAACVLRPENPATAIYELGKALESYGKDKAYVADWVAWAMFALWKRPDAVARWLGAVAKALEGGRTS